MQPDILLADEILAVGDIAFQERCLDRVAQEAERGLTVLFVSHDMAAVSRLCHRSIWLDKGEVAGDGDPEAVIADYEAAALRMKGREAAFGQKTGRHANVMAEILSVRLLNTLGEEIGAAPTAEDVYVRIRLKVRKPGTALRGFVDVHAKRFLLFRTEQTEPVIADHRGVFDLLVRIPAHLLAATTYVLNVTVYTALAKEAKVVLDNALTFMAYSDQAGGQLKRGLIAPRLEWTLQSHVSARKRKTVV
jgi:ABC-type molybdate transport system ATPase subunit